MSFKKRLEFGNYTLKFGQDKVLLDFISTIVEPSFRERRYVRKIKNKAEFFFLDTQIINLSLDDGSQTAAIAGRIVKNTKLKREQIFSKGGIVHDKKELETAPSSIFVLLLENHRLIFCREVIGAPTIQNFESTSQSFLNHSHKEYVHEIFSKNTEANTLQPKLQKTKSSILKDCPPPVLRVTPLTDNDSIENFIKRFKTIEELTIKLLPTNQEEINNDEFWQHLENSMEKMHSKSTTIRYANNKKGLESSEVIAQSSAATEMGNSAVSLSGHDSEGGRIKGNNSDFSLTVEIEDLPTSIESAGKVMHNEFKALTRRNFITLPAIASGILDTVKDFADRHTK